jgi:branched-chain amino acid transport system substrate-binding protein
MKRRNRVGKVCALGLLLAIVFILGFQGPAQAADKTLKVGIIMPLSGPISIVGVGLTRAVELYFDKVNAEGGLKLGKDTYKLKLIAEDDKTDPTSAATAAKKLVYKDGTRFVFGTIGTAEAAAIYQVCEPAKALHMITWLNAPLVPGDVSPKKPYAVRLTPSSDAAWEMDYEYIRKNYPEAKRLFMIAPDQSLPIDRAKKVAKNYGFEVLGVELWQRGTTDFLPYYTKIMATKPDVIQAMCSAQSGYQLKAARQLGFKGHFISDAPTAPDLIMKVAGADASYNVLCNGMDLAKATPEMKDCMDEWAKKFKEPFFSDSIMNWVQAEVFVQMLKKANSVDPAKVIAAFDKMTAPGSIQTAYGPGHMGGAKRFGTNRVLIRPLPMSRVMDGKIEFLGFKMPVVDQ